MDYYRTADRLPTEADGDEDGHVMATHYGELWFVLRWDEVHGWDLWRRCVPSDYAPPKPREPREPRRWTGRATIYASYIEVSIKKHDSAHGVHVEDGIPVEIIEQLPEGKSGSPLHAEWCKRIEPGHCTCGGLRPEGE